MVIINLQVSLGSQGQVKEAVGGEEVEHVVQEGDAGVDIHLAAAI